MTETARRLAFQTVPRDPIQTRIYTLENGLRLFMTVNREEPRVQTEIAVRAGSKHDPADATGLAHYFEHMMFKGTDRLGALDWPTEKLILDRIEQLFEDHRNTNDPERKRLIYRSFLSSTVFKAHRPRCRNATRIVSRVSTATPLLES